jgi:hypothetical protein
MIIAGLMLFALKFWLVRTGWNLYREWLNERDEDAAKQLNIQPHKDLNQ